MQQRPYLLPLLLLTACLFPLSAGAQSGVEPSSTDRIELASGEIVELRQTSFEAGRWSSVAEKRPLLVTFSGKAGAEWTRVVLEAGAEIVSAAPPASFLVRADAAAAKRLWTAPEVKAVTEVEARWKLEPGLTIATKAMNDGDAVDVDIVVFAGEGTERVDARVRGHGSEQGRRTSLGRAVVRARVSPIALLEIAAFPEVQWIEPAGVGRTMNDSIRVVMQTERQHFLANSSFYNPVYGIGVNGSTQLVAVSDTGLRVSGFPPQVSHEVFDAPGKIASYTAPAPGGFICGILGDAPSHGTAVANTLAGDKLGTSTGLFGFPNNYDGVAYASRLFVQDVFDDVGEGNFCENLSTVDDILLPALNAGARVHNNSWGHTEQSGYCAVPRGGYTSRSQEIDAHLSQGAGRESVVVFAVGNFGRWPHPYTSCWGSSPWSLRPRTVSEEAHAKNVIAVGASRDEALRDQMYLYSSRGPTNDCFPVVPGTICSNPGRIKPDLVAPGSKTIRSAEVTTASSYCAVNSGACPDGYVGTSHAAPAISGAAALVRDYFAKGKYPASAPPIVGTPSSALVKAMLVNSSVFLSDASAYEATVAVGGTNSTYPNYDQGYGRPALDSVLEPAGYRKLKAYQDTTTQLATEETWTVTPFFSHLWNATCNTLRVTLAWTDPPATLGINPVLVNDLDLEVTFQNRLWRGNHGLTGNQPDRFNNVEDVFIPVGQLALGVTQAPIIRVRGTRVMTPARQPFAVVVTYGPCFGYTPCPEAPSVGCYDGPGDIVPGSKPNPRPGCLDQTYTIQEWCPTCMPPPWPACQPPQLPQPKPAIPIEPDEQP